MKIENQNILITGANRGIGLGFAKACARRKTHLLLAIRKTDENLVQELKALGALSVEIIESDLSTRAGVESLIQKIQNKKIDILFNNAGLLTGGLLDEQKIDDIHQMLQVNVNALIQLTHAVVPKMVLQKHGKIINHSSVSAVMHFPSASTYAASKAAVWAFTDCLEQELKGTGVSTLCLFTPGIKTRMFDEIDKLYSKNIEVPKDSISPDEYALRIISAIESDQTHLEPVGMTGIAFKTATHFKSLFNFGVSKAFKGR
jgi:short-subunit dehydrogenase